MLPHQTRLSRNRPGVSHGNRSRPSRVPGTRHATAPAAATQRDQRPGEPSVAIRDHQARLAPPRSGVTPQARTHSDLNRTPVRPPRCYDVTITVNREGGNLPNPAEFAVAAQQAASARRASVVSAHTAGQIISVVAVLAADRPAAVAIALTVVSDALRCPVASVTSLTPTRQDPCSRS